ncbi:MAG: BlaI/MecI/CopY family transcriptional regulator [Bacteroidales bacterium]|nr:MAG: BlaI/MecI/CopY family transcriptional regulator [Bacteroidales bacterium]
MNKIKPTAAELEILQILWKYKSATVKFVHQQINHKKNVGYTTTLKIMQNMAAKNIVKRELNGKSHVYIPVLKQEETQNILLNRFLETAFSGSASNLVMQVLGNHKTSKEELKQIKELIKKLDGGK